MYPAELLRQRLLETTLSTSLKSNFDWHDILPSLGNCNFCKVHEKLRSEYEFWHFINVLNGRLERSIQIDSIPLFVFVAAFLLFFVVLCFFRFKDNSFECGCFRPVDDGKELVSEQVHVLSSDTRKVK